MIDKEDSAGPAAPLKDCPSRVQGDVTVRFEIPGDVTEEGLRLLLDECHRAAEVAVGRVLTECGYEHGERSRRERVYQALRDGPPLLDPVIFAGCGAVLSRTGRGPFRARLFAPLSRLATTEVAPPDGAGATWKHLRCRRFATRRNGETLAFHMTDLRLDWNAIRPLNGSRATGFEELCAQLARAESPAGSRFVRKGAPDAGVECYTAFASGTEWAWQAKYFDALGDSQWAQLDKSVDTALTKHPRLARYVVCVPYDRPDARVEGQQSALQRWTDHVAKWTSWASSKGMTVEFIYWGSHELLDRLARPEHVGRVRFWFDAHGFDGAWFSARLEEALSTAGPRYTPEINVDLPIAREFDAFGRTDSFFKIVKSHGRQIRESFRLVGYARSKVADSDVEAAAIVTSTTVQQILDALGGVEAEPTGPLPFKTILGHLADAEAAVDRLEKLLATRAREQDAKERATGAERERRPYLSNPFRDYQVHLRKLGFDLHETHKALEHADTVSGTALMLLLGDAGTGKTHLLCDLARRRIAAGQPTVLLMGQQFVSNDAPWRQALDQLDMSGVPADEFVGALGAAAEAAGSRALLLVDALNEGAGRNIWPTHLPAFLVHAARSPWISAVLSVRSSYEEIVVPAEVRDRAVRVTHNGFLEHEYDATKTFFVHYGLELPSTPLLAPEFRNPLFLKTVCRGLNLKGERRLPRGFQGITAIFELYLSAINGRLAPTLGFDPRTPLVRQALEAVAGALVDAEKPWLWS